MLDDILEAYPEDEFYTADGLNNAIIGIDEKSMKLIYSVKRILEIFECRDGMSNEEALEYFEYNVAGAYLSEGGKDITPIYAYDIF